MSKSNTPQSISKNVNRLLSTLRLSTTPVYVSVQPEPGAIVSECFSNVELKIQTSGGKMLCGWQIWEWPNVMIEAEFHAIWQNPAGELIDITPKQDKEKTILFADAPHQIYEGARIDNVMIALRDDAVVRHFIQVSELIYKRMQEHNDVERGLVSIPEALFNAKSFLLQAL